MNWFERMKSGLKTRIKREVPEGVWSRCDKCGHSLFQNTLSRNSWICPDCGHHLRIGHEQYVELLADHGSFTELDPTLTAGDPLKFKDHKRYPDRVKAGRRESGLNESVYTGVARIGGHPVALGVMDSRFIMGSLGSATGEKIARLIDRAIAERRSLVLICQSGGAPHAGERVLAHADGQGQRQAEPTQPLGTALHRGFNRSHLRRRHG